MENPFERSLKSPRDEEPFDPHSVLSELSVEEQFQAEEIRRHLAMDGVIPSESRQEEVGMEISGFRAPQYGVRRERIQDDKEITAPVEESTPAEWHAKLEKLVKKFSK